MYDHWERYTAYVSWIYHDEPRAGRQDYNGNCLDRSHCLFRICGKDNTGNARSRYGRVKNIFTITNLYDKI